MFVRCFCKLNVCLDEYELFARPRVAGHYRDHQEKTNQKTRHDQFQRDPPERITYKQIPKAHAKHNKLTIQQQYCAKVISEFQRISTEFAEIV